jgi:hypothetical protein
VIKKLRQRSGLIGDISAFLVILALVGGLIWLWWAAAPKATGPSEILNGEVVSIGIRPANRRGNSVVMSANAEGTRQVTLIDRSLGFQGCKVGSKFKLRRISSSTGFTNYKFVPGSCTKP